ncbi:hypothetical protein CDR19_04260 [Ectopseudomonas toyotomiensis]|uniref:Uncharacterized protein n=1 Tax=Ectopseudomonas toyotomiensis TaxID=554344 RepID=A0A1I5R252_9GAMM|nr:hypothetical protein [Pseudomonas toyotomiensis]PIA74284.1 hypothetical protein CDR19_04260 [Pseudomonas toyotomiensis]SFP52126.1 hypothetical protein SAMN05216177_103232 [Pseudomonas toyotomiensis]
MNAEQQQRLRELALIMLRDAHGEDFTAEEAAMLPAQIEEYQCLSEAQNILSLLDEVMALRMVISDCATACGAAVSPDCTLTFMQQLPGEIAAVIGRLQLDKARLDSGCIVTNDRNEFGESYKTERRGMNLRASIDEAMAMHARDIANG